MSLGSGGTFDTCTRKLIRRGVVKNPRRLVLSEMSWRMSRRVI
jgi:hypothetical protein